MNFVSFCVPLCICVLLPLPRDKPYLLFFDLSDCIYVTTTALTRIIEDDNASLLFTCPTPQVNYLIAIFKYWLCV